MATPKLCKRRDLPFGVMGYGQWNKDLLPLEPSIRYFRCENFKLTSVGNSFRDPTYPYSLLIISDTLAVREQDLKLRTLPITEDSWFDENCLYFEE